MRPSLVNLATVLLATASLVAAQTWTDCNPMKKTCPDNPALAGTYTWDYTSKKSAATDFKVLAGSDVIKYNDEGALFRVEKKLDAPTIVSNFYIMWGHIDVEMKAAPGGGVISSVVLQSDNLDEIDWEWVGSKPGEAQSNYFGKGNTDAYDRGAVHPVSSQDTFHTYSLDWTEEKLDWIIDGVVVRTLKPSDVNGDYYPQTPMQLRLGSWAAGDSDNEKGTIAWSGGPIDYNKGPYDMVIKNMKVVDYSTGTAYQYSDQSGSWKSIKSLGGKIGAGPQSGKGNTGNLATPSSSASSPDATSRGPVTSKAGLLIPTTSLATKTGANSEPTQIGGGNKAADSMESTLSPTSPTSPVSALSTRASDVLTGAGSQLGAVGGPSLTLLAGMAMGWILI